ncbi:hypothetical protein G5C40_26745 [Burkholderia pseudomallei]|uniref:hypothetical protein n=1 Tax=Burkholderia pseudomallei TaxID=28450 RepID=UPI000F1CBBCA|nr:hypothetical protein [Burkholderia pseudomallei]MBD2915543.1 hypothetical protein [Burkholderia pseudomallei]MBD2927696.1 hypothetical protein [Burkholderia pseudomallei]MBD2930374.1 hypothetical protein [Burkholderia pseudomallei]MBD2967040.1 hypothetical protein [Burkholderia pseudomallei]CAJ9463902.1 Uncharacterised protein [Burkholderia pseudomallei]
MTLRAPTGIRKALQVVDSSESGEPRRRKRKVRLANAKDVRRELAAVYRAHVNGELDLTTAKGRAYILDMMRAAIETDELEQKLELLEQRAEGV